MPRFPRAQPVEEPLDLPEDPLDLPEDPIDYDEPIELPQDPVPQVIFEDPIEEPEEVFQELYDPEEPEEPSDPAPSDPDPPTATATSDDDQTAEVVWPTSEHELLAKIYEVLHASNTSQWTDAVAHLRKMLSCERNPPIQDAIDANLVPRLLELLSEEDDTLKFEIAWALTNMVSGTSAQCAEVVGHGLIPRMVELLSLDNLDVKEQAIWALGNIAGDSTQMRDTVNDAGAAVALSELFLGEMPNLSMVRNGTWAISNLCRGKPGVDADVSEVLLAPLMVLIEHTDSEVLIDAGWALSYLSDDISSDNHRIQSVLDSGCLPRIVSLLLHNDPKVQTPALRTIGNLVSGDDLQTALVLEADVLPCLLVLLGHSKQNIRKEACWTLSNITAGSSAQIQLAMDANIIPRVVAMMDSSTTPEVIRKEAVWIIGNATSGGTSEQIRQLVELQIIPPICECLEESNPRIVTVAIEALENILKADADATDANFKEQVELCDGLDKLLGLNAHENSEVQQKATQILERYFEIGAVPEDPA